MKLAKTMRPTRAILVNSGPGRQGHRHRGRPVGGDFSAAPAARASPSKANGGLAPSNGRRCHERYSVPNRIHFAALKAQGRKALIPFVTAGFTPTCTPASCTLWLRAVPT